MEIRYLEKWWLTLNQRDMLELAYILSKHVLVLWDNYNFPESLKDKSVPLKALPGEALQEISLEIDKNEFNKDRINKFFTLFVTPVLQIRDGNLKLPYTVKSSFLSVFNILKGILYLKDKSQAIDSFTLSISRSLDAIRFSKILSTEEVSKLTQKYFLLSLKAKRL